MPRTLDSETEEDTEPTEESTEESDEDYQPKKKVKKNDEIPIQKPPSNVLPPIKPKNLDELIQLAELCKDQSFMNTIGLYESLPFLHELQSMIGQQKAKQQIVELTIRCLQKDTFQSIEFPHLLIVGCPGLGKSTLIHILSGIFAAVGMTEKNKIVNARMPLDFIGGVLGETARLTYKTFQKARGGILAIDELHTLGDNRNASSPDAYAKSCADQINLLLSPESGMNVVVFGCGYEKELKRDFFPLNPGLLSRFPTIICMEIYSPAELKQISLKLFHDKKLILENPEDLKEKWFLDKTLFHAYGRSVVVYVENVICVLSFRVFGDPCKSIVIKDDLYNGLLRMKSTHSFFKMK